MLVVFVSGMAGWAMAEEMTLTTYYPSPRGIYDELRSNTMEISKTLRLNPQGTARPACEETTRGSVWFAQDVTIGGLVVDALQFCALVSGEYRWVTVVGASS